MKLASLSLALIAALAGCGGDEPVDGVGLDLRDPLDLIGDVDGDLRLMVFPADSHSCDPASGLVTPSPPEDRGAMIPEAVVDVTVSTGDPQAMVQLDPGTYTILVRGWGTDVVSGRMNTIIASGCTGDQAIEAGETREVGIDLIQIFGEGVCGDGIVSPDEQCDDNDTMDGDGCSATCRTEPFLVSRPTGGAMANEQFPNIDWKQGARVAVAYESDAGPSRDAQLMLLSESGAIIESPTALQFDGAAASIAGVQTTPDVAIGGGRIAVAFADFQNADTQGGDIRVQFLDTSRNPTGSSVSATVPDRGPSTEQTSGAQIAPAIAAMGDGTTMVVFQDDRSATGLSAQVFASGSTDRAGDDIEVGTGASGATAPAIAALPDGFLVAFTAGGDVLYQRFGSDGSATDASAQPALMDAGGTQDQPAVAAMPDGTALVAWRDSGGDGAGTAIRAAVIGADGTAGAPTVVNTTTAGDQANPSVTAGADRFVVAFESGSAIRASLLNTEGVLALNREADPAAADFPVAPAGAVPGVAAGGPVGSSMWIAIWRQGGAANGDVHGRLFPLP